MLKRALVALLLAMLPAQSWGQATVLQGGSWTDGILPIYTTTGGVSQPTIRQSSTAAGGAASIKEMSIVARGSGTAPYVGSGGGFLGSIFCAYDAPPTNATGGHQLCLSPDATGGYGLLSFNAFGSASSIPFKMNINGTTLEFPFSTTGVVGPSSSTVGHIAVWNNTSGTLLADGGVALTVGGTNGQIQYNNSGALGGFTMAGDCTLSQPTITCTKINNVTVSLGGALTTGGPFTTAGASALTLTTSGVTNVSLPASGTLSTLAGSEALTNKTYNGNTWTAGTGTLTIGAGKTLTASSTLTFSGTDGSTLNVGTGGTLGTAAYLSSGTSAGNVPVLNGSGFLLSSLLGAQSISANGYQTFGASGAIMQWGTSGSAAGSGTVAVTFPLACSTAVYSVTMTPNHVTSGTQEGDYVSSVSTSGFTINNRGSNAGTYYWSAVCK